MLRKKMGIKSLYKHMLMKYFLKTLKNELKVIFKINI